MNDIFHSVGCVSALFGKGRLCHFLRAPACPKLQKDESEADRAIASSMRAALAELPFATAASVAKTVKVSEATVGRFCRCIGYTSLFLHEGRVAEQGSPEEMFPNPKTQVFQRFITKVK